MLCSELFGPVCRNRQLTFALKSEIHVKIDISDYSENMKLQLKSQKDVHKKCGANTVCRMIDYN